MRLHTVAIIGLFGISTLSASDPMSVCVGDYSESDFLNISLPVEPWTWSVGASKVREAQVTETVILPTEIAHEGRPSEGVVLKHYPHPFCEAVAGSHFVDAALADLQRRFPSTTVSDLRAAPSDRFVSFQAAEEGPSGYLRLTRSRTGWFEIAYVQFVPTSEQVWLAWQEAIGRATLHHREEVAAPADKLKLPRAQRALLPQIAGPLPAGEPLAQATQSIEETVIQQEVSVDPESVTESDDVEEYDYLPSDGVSEEQEGVNATASDESILPTSTEGEEEGEADGSILGVQFVSLLSRAVASQRERHIAARQKPADVQVSDELESGDYDTNPVPYEEVSDTMPDEDEETTVELSMISDVEIATEEVALAEIAMAPAPTVETQIVYVERPVYYCVQVPVYCTLRPVPPPSQVRACKRTRLQREYGPTLLDKCWVRRYGKR